MKYVILIPIYNDRESLKLLIENINNEIKGLNHEISVVVINDASSQQILDTYIKRYVIGLMITISLPYQD